MALIVWALCIAVLLGPAALVWIVRGVGFAAQCAPGPDLCRGIMLGGGLRDALSLAWGVGTDVLLMMVLALIAAVACFRRAAAFLGRGQPGAAAHPDARAADARGLCHAL